MKVRRVAGQYNHRSGWIRLKFLGVEFFSDADVEDAGNDCVDADTRNAGAASA